MNLDGEEEIVTRQSEFNQLYGDFADACKDIEDARKRLGSLVPRINAKKTITVNQAKRLNELWEKLMDWFGPAEELTSEICSALVDLEDRSGISDEDLVD